MVQKDFIEVVEKIVDNRIARKAKGTEGLIIWYGARLPRVLVTRCYLLQFGGKVKEYINLMLTRTSGSSGGGGLLAP